MAQDQVSARLCPEYFTIGHPPIEGLSDPTLLGISWGFLGGWPGGLLFGIPVALAATLGRLPALTASQLVRPVLAVLAAVALGTGVAGASAWYNADICDIGLGETWSAVPAPRRRAFFVVACAHFATYLSAALGAVGLCAWIVRRRTMDARRWTTKSSAC
jgi:hypothetical protein